MWATSDDVIDSWIGEDAPADEGLVQRWVERAERLIRREFPRLQSRIDSSAEPELEERVVDVVVAMVTRVFRNPSGHRSLSGQGATGPFSGTDTITYGGDNPGALDLLDSERSALSGDDNGTSRRAFSVMPGGIR